MIAKNMDRVVRSMQWPAAYSLAVFSPWILAVVGLWLARSPNYPVYAAMFWLGAAATLAVSRSRWVSSKILKSAIRMERRITQGILSFLLLQPTSTILAWGRTKLGLAKKGSPTSNEVTQWLTDDNWLIRTSPYFLPTASIVLWLLSALVLPAFLRSFVLGVGVSYHLLSVYIQLRYPEPYAARLDYPKRFLLLFLIPVNLLVFVTGYAFALQGFWGLQMVAADLTWPLVALWKMTSGPLLSQ